jgi:MATE family multidrug resistance protein
VWARLPGLFPFLFFVACRGYLQALGNTRPIVVATVLANIVNLIGNALLIFGDASLVKLGLPAIGLPALGVVGSALATSIAQVAMLGVLVLAIRAQVGPSDPTHRRRDPAVIRTIFRLGTPLGLQMLAELGVFTTCNVLAGRMSKDASAGYQLAITMASFTFMFAIGVGAATSVRVGQAVGRDDTPGARQAGFAGLKLIVGIMAVPALLFLVIPELLARIFTNDETVIAATVPLLRIAAVFQLSDGIQGVAAGALRGAGDPEIALWANVVGHWAVGLPVALVLGHLLGMGAPGLWWGLSAGLTVVAVWLTWRFARVSSRPIARV